MKIKSPLRYPGGKSRAVNKIIPLVPSFNEYREPFIGGGSVFVEVKQLFPNKHYWINDLNKDLYLFWYFSKTNIKHLVQEITKIKTSTINGRPLFESYKENNVDITDINRVVRFFVLNRITFSGTVDSGGYSEESFQKRFTSSSIERLENLSTILSNVKITNLDYQEVIEKKGDEVFIFLDPPYYSTTKSKLYGKKGDLHFNFDHKRFSDQMKKCKHKWLITYDDCDEVRNLFDFAYILPWSLQYGMNNYKKEEITIGSELFISNYPLPKNFKTQ
jgi:DNA adenine methylase